MKKEVIILREKALSSLMLAVELFNRPWDRGRVDGFLIFLDHSFEMLLKAAILHLGGEIRKRGEEFTLGFEACLRKAHTQEGLCFASQEQVLQLQAINSLRDAAQHHIIDISEQHLYLHAQAGLTLFKDILEKVFNVRLHSLLPNRILPISTSPPIDLASLFEKETQQIKQILKPRHKRSVEASAKLRSLSILEGALSGEKTQPSDKHLRKIATAIREGRNWQDIFPGVAAIEMTQKGYGLSIDLRITKKDGIPVHIVPESEASHVIALKRVDELSFYFMGLTELAKQVELTGPKTTAVIKHLKLKNDPQCYRHFKVSGSQFGRYSEKAANRIKECVNQISIDIIWEDYSREVKKGRKRHAR